jgi:uncharacterized membrane protein
MAQDKTNAVESTASIAGHPIHPILVPFPIAFFVGALASDLAYWWTIDLFWARVSLWLVGAGVVTAVAAAIFGLIDFLTIRRVRSYSDAWIHLIGNGTVILLQGISWYLRWAEGLMSALPWGLTISGAAALLLVVTGWFGGELAYRHRIGTFSKD